MALSAWSEKMKNKFLISIVILIACSAICHAKTIYVREGGTGAGTSWADAYGSFQDGLDNAAANDHIWVAQGTYKPSYDYGLALGDRGKHFRMKNNVAIYGGFPNTDDPDMTDRDPNQYETILSGDIGTIDDNSDNCYHVFCHPDFSYISSTAILDGFTITAGNANGASPSPYDYGGGMLNFSSDIAGSLCSPTVIGCKFISNSANSGGGMCNTYFNSNPTVIGCTFAGNRADLGSGGGMSNTVSSPIVSNCTFTGNIAFHNGGGMSSGNWNQTVINCTFTGNSADYGGGISFFVDSMVGPRYLTVTNCIIWGNTATSDWQIFHFGPGGTIVNYSDIQGGWAGDGSNNIDADPMFVDANGPDGIAGTADDDQHIRNYSPCINAGDNSAVTEATDMDGLQRIRYSYVDMGAYEVYPIAGDFEPDEDVDIFDFASFGAAWLDSCDEANTWCDKKDIDQSGTVDFNDLICFVNQWLYGTLP